jgi:hypothetical protein
MKEKMIEYLNKNSQIKMTFDHYDRGWFYYTGISVDGEDIELILGKADYEIYPNDSNKLCWWTLPYFIEHDNVLGWTLKVNDINLEDLFK